MDRTLVERVAGGDRDAFEQLARRHYRSAYLVALGVLGNRMDAEDACQEGFVKALSVIESCRDPGKFRSWLLQIVRNHARNATQARRVRRTESLDDPEIRSPAVSDADPAVRADLAWQLERALARLTQRQREIVLLHDLDGWGHGTIATMLGISEVACRQQLFVARSRLREHLGPNALEELINDR